MDWSFRWGLQSYPDCSIPESFGSQVGPWTQRGDSWERAQVGAVVAEVWPGAFQFRWRAGGADGYAKTPEDGMAAADAALAESRVTRG